MKTCDCCLGTGDCPVCSGSGRFGELDFTVSGSNADDVRKVAGTFLDMGLRHLRERDKSEAVLAGYEFERQIAAIYRTLGARVEVDVGLAGSQVDILVKEQTTSGLEIRTAIECKSYQRPVGIRPVNSFAMIVEVLRRRRLIDRATVVSRSGFTRQARQAATEYSIELVELADLQQRARGKVSEVASAEREIADYQSAPNRQRAKRVFVVMPFAEGFNDVYALGIREVAEQLGITVERADDIEHTQSIPNVIRARIRAADAIIGDTTGSNPNVFYEIGYADGLKTPTILIASKGSEVPFDLSSVNHIMYESIVDLRNRLRRRLSALLGVENPADGPTGT